MSLTVAYRPDLWRNVHALRAQAQELKRDHVADIDVYGVRDVIA